MLLLHCLHFKSILNPGPCQQFSSLSIFPFVRTMLTNTNTDARINSQKKKKNWQPKQDLPKKNKMEG